MDEIKTDMFPEVLRMKAKNKQGDDRKNNIGSTQSNTAIPVEVITESSKQGDGR